MKLKRMIIKIRGASLNDARALMELFQLLKDGYEVESMLQELRTVTFELRKIMGDKRGNNGQDNEKK